jgi:hypothetical protein
MCVLNYLTRLKCVARKVVSWAARIFKVSTTCRWITWCTSEPLYLAGTSARYNVWVAGWASEFCGGNDEGKFRALPRIELIVPSPYHKLCILIVMFMYSYCYFMYSYYYVHVSYCHVYVFLLLCLCILIVMFMYSYCYVYVFLLLCLCILIVKTTLFSGHYLRNRSTLDIGVLGYMGVL